MKLLPINLDDLINARAVESIRIEYKTSWTELTKKAICKSICAFANDIMNLNGGYIILGIEEQNGLPILPPKGLSGHNFDHLQQEIRVICKKIDPEYQPLIIPERFMNEDILIIWVPGGDNRPYKAPDERNPKEQVFYVRQGSESVKAKDDLLRQLMELTAKTPYDDRLNHTTNVLDISPILVKRYLSEVKSDLLSNTPPLSDEDLYRALRIVGSVHNYLVPRNCSLMFFSERPDKFFEGCRFEVVQFGDDAGGNLIEERKFVGPINLQIESVLDYLDNLTNVQLLKVPGKAKVDRNMAYPYEALEESVVNAAYHRSYDNSTEPNKIYLYPDRIEIISYPGPVAGVKLEHFRSAGPVPPVPTRNRRVGEFLKELRLAEMRGTGIPKIKRTMEQNGSPAPTIDFDENKTYFRIVLPAHPRYVVVHALRESSYLWSIGEKNPAIELLQKTFNQNPNSGSIAGQLIEYYYIKEVYEKAETTFEQFHREKLRYEPLQPYLRYFKLLGGAGKSEDAKRVILMASESDYDEDPYEIGLAFKRLKINDRAHTFFLKSIHNMIPNLSFCIITLKSKP